MKIPTLNRDLNMNFPMFFSIVAGIGLPIGLVGLAASHSIFGFLIGWFIGLMSANILMVARNSWVCRKRIEMIDEDYYLYKRLPSYDYMIATFWNWNFRSYLK